MDLTNTDILINRQLFQRIEEKKKRIDTLRPLPKNTVKKLLEDIRLKHTYHSIALEGNTLTLKETKLVVEDGITIGGKLLKDHLEAKNSYEAFNLILEMVKSNTKITHETIQGLHELVTKGLLEDAGKYRKTNIRIAGLETTPPDYNKLPKIMDEYIKNIETLKLHPVKKAAFVHHELVRIHPFIDGNGRVARLLTNLFLMKNGYPPIVLKKEDRRQYFRVLQYADNRYLSPFSNFIAKAVHESIMYYLSSLLEDEQLIPLKELSKDSPYSQEYLSLRARQGQLDAIKIEKIWYSSKQALQDYILKVGR
ncbi:MAG: Fic family protein [Thermoplasmatales archaeon]|nr:Fic family protein [Thermoplasmatales archaeon]